MGYASRTRDLNEVRDGGFRAYLTFLADRVSVAIGRWDGGAAGGAARRRLERRIKTLDSDVKCAGKEKNI